MSFIFGAVDLPVFTENRVSVGSKPSHASGYSKSTEFVVPRLKVLYYNNSFFPRSVGLYKKRDENVKSMSVPHFQKLILSAA
jgi:hypothetical protein